MKPKVTRSSDTLVYIRTTRCHIPDDENIHNYRCENLLSYIKLYLDSVMSGGGTTENLSSSHPYPRPVPSVNTYQTGFIENRQFVCYELLNDTSRPLDD
jgi:hypothetical protein